MMWHRYSEEKPKPSEICLIKYFYDKQKFGESKPQYMLCEYSFRGEESSEPWTELNGDAETYGIEYSEFWLSISEIEDFFKKLKPSQSWHYTINDRPEQNVQCFCDTGEFYGYQTLTYNDTEFYDKECLEFDVIRWVRVSDVVNMLNRGE